MFSFAIRMHQKLGRVEFRVYGTRRAMRKAMERDWDGWKKPNNAVGACLRTKESPPKCYIYLSKQDLGVGVVSHEVTHALLWMFRERGWTTYAHNSNREEYFCYCVETLNKEFWNQWYESQDK